MTGAAALVALAEEEVRAMILVFARIGAVALFLPPMGEGSLPARVRLAVGLALSVILLPVAPVRAPEAEPGAFMATLVAEGTVGLAIGILLRLAVIALQICGTIIAQATSLAQLMGAAGLEPLPVIGHILVVSGLALAVMADLHLRVAFALLGSYDIVPLGAALSPAAFSEAIVGRVSAMFGLAFSLAAPFVIAALLYNLALGAINRAMPQLMVVLVGAPAIVGATLALLALVAPFLLQVWLTALHGALAAPLGGP